MKKFGKQTLPLRQAYWGMLPLIRIPIISLSRLPHQFFWQPIWILHQSRDDALLLMKERVDRGMVLNFWQAQMYTCNGFPNLLLRNDTVKGDSRVMNTKVYWSTEYLWKHSGLWQLPLGMNNVAFWIKITKTTTVVRSRNAVVLLLLDDVRNSLLGGVQLMVWVWLLNKPAELSCWFQRESGTRQSWSVRVCTFMPEKRDANKRYVCSGGCGERVRFFLVWRFLKLSSSFGSHTFEFQQDGDGDGFVSFGDAFVGWWFAMGGKCLCVGEEKCPPPATSKQYF